MTEQIFMLDLRTPVLGDADDPRIALVRTIRDRILNTEDRIVIYAVDNDPGPTEVLLTRVFLVSFLAEINSIKVLALMGGTNILTIEELLNVIAALDLLRQRDVEVRSAEPWMLS